MVYRGIKTIAAPVALALSVAVSGITPAVADQIDQVHQNNKQRTKSAVQSQARIDKLNQQRLDLLDKFKAENKVIDGLKVYNAQMQKRIKAQEQELQKLEDSIVKADELKRQVTPLMLEMLDALEQTVSLDVPFQKKEREDRIQFIKDAMVDPKASDAEKFRLILEAYQIEISDYGRLIDAYTSTIPLNGNDVDVNLLQVGRIGLFAQTTDERSTLVWDNNAREWVELDGSYRNPIRQAIRIASKRATKDILMLPIAAPETAQ